MPQSQHGVSDKLPVFMVSGSKGYLNDVTNVINPYYNARSFDDTSKVLDELFVSPIADFDILTV
jgi:hypothetical protein